VTIISDKRAFFAEEISGEIKKNRSKTKAQFKCLKLPNVPEFIN